MDINTRINLMQLNNIPVPRTMLEQGVTEAAAEISQIIRELPQKCKDEINEACEKHNREYRERNKELLNNLSPIPVVRVQTLVDVLLQESNKFVNMTDQEVYDLIEGDFYDLFFELDSAISDFSYINEKHAEGNITFLPKAIGASIRESAIKIHEALKSMSIVLSCDTDDDIVNVFKNYTILFSYMQNFL